MDRPPSLTIVHQLLFQLRKYFRSGSTEGEVLGHVFFATLTVIALLGLQLLANSLFFVPQVNCVELPLEHFDIVLPRYCIKLRSLDKKVARRE
jgi:hypothetical protein